MSATNRGNRERADRSEHEGEVLLLTMSEAARVLSIGRTTPLRTRRDAERFANTVEADLLRGLWVDPRAGQMTLEQYADEWLARKTNLRQRTHELYEHQLRAHIYPRLGPIELAKLSPKT